MIGKMFYKLKVYQFEQCFEFAQCKVQGTIFSWSKRHFLYTFDNIDIFG